MVHYRLAEQGRFRLSKPVLRWNSTRKVLPKGGAREVSPPGRNPYDELALAAQQRLVLRAVEPDRHALGPLNVIGA
jgi:hypothetical protein